MIVEELVCKLGFEVEGARPSEQEIRMKAIQIAVDLGANEETVIQIADRIAKFVDPDISTASPS